MYLIGDDFGCKGSDNPYYYLVILLSLCHFADFSLAEFLLREAKRCLWQCLMVVKFFRLFCLCVCLTRFLGGILL